jgi:hypothetical protein
MLRAYHQKERSFCDRKSVLFNCAGSLSVPAGSSRVVPSYSTHSGVNAKEDPMGLIELLLIVLVIAAVAGGIGVSPLLWLLLLVALLVFFTGGGFGYRRGGRV